MSRPNQPDLSTPPTGRPTSRRTHLWLLAAIALFLLQTLPFLSYRWVTDESWYAAPAYSLVHGDGMRDPALGPNELENHFDARPPGTALVIAAGFKLFGTGQIAARIGSVLAGLLVVVLVYRLSRELFGVPGALCATFVIATDNLLVLTSRTARPEALTTMCIFAGLLALQKYANLRKPAYAFACGLVMAAGTMFHITLLGYLISFGLLFLFLDKKRGDFILRGALTYWIGFAIGLVPFALWIFTAPRGLEGFHEEFLNRAIKVPLLEKFLHEGRRYSDVLGFHMLSGHLGSLPVRLPIPLFFLFASYLLWRYKRSWFYVELVLLVPSILWLIYTVNKSSRYVAIVGPLFALAVGAAIRATEERANLRRWLTYGTLAVVVVQASANFLLLHNARKANYSELGAKLRAFVPVNATVFGTITFWLAFHDHPFISYERTTPHMAADLYGARYFIVGDRMMTQGEPDDRFYLELNQDLKDLEVQSKLVGEVVDPYYGDLKIYHLEK
ncbi:ArnT family glycosyltransferase [Terriglobus saanensis]|uniref:ArnT family glycosyltransferase n=1 Tax=Terriglobus saanensis TaxID=870903 RepID=UPI0002DAA7C6|nr:glycosyltransferase family 39 protein [Terriglobus saanensis]